MLLWKHKLIKFFKCCIENDICSKKGEIQVILSDLKISKHNIFFCFERLFFTEFNSFMILLKLNMFFLSLGLLNKFGARAHRKSESFGFFFVFAFYHKKAFKLSIYIFLIISSKRTWFKKLSTFWDKGHFWVFQC